MARDGEGGCERGKTGSLNPVPCHDGVLFFYLQQSGTLGSRAQHSPHTLSDPSDSGTTVARVSGKLPNRTKMRQASVAWPFILLPTLGHGKQTAEKRDLAEMIYVMS